MSGSKVNEENEVWKEVEWYDGDYLISNLGRVISKKSGKPKLMVPHPNGCGYLQVVLSKNSTTKTFRIHRLVALLFVPIVEGKSVVNHIDGVRTNNCASNLEWVTHLENTQHAQKLGTIPKVYPRTVVYGISKERKFTKDQVLKLRQDFSIGKYSAYQLAKEYGVDTKTMSDLLRGKTYKILDPIPTIIPRRNRKREVYKPRKR